MKNIKTFEAFVNEADNMRTLKGFVKAIKKEYGPTPTHQSLADFIYNNYESVTGEELEDSDPASNDHIADIIAYFKMDGEDFMIAWEDRINEGITYASSRVNGKDIYSTWSGSATTEKDFIKMIKEAPETLSSIKVQSGTDVFNPSSEEFKGPINSSKKAKIIKLVKDMTKTFKAQGDDITAYELRSYGGVYAKDHDSSAAYIVYKTDRSDNFAKDMSAGKYGPLD